MMNPSSTRTGRMKGEFRFEPSAAAIVGVGVAFDPSWASHCDELRFESASREHDGGRPLPTSIWSARHDGSIAFLDDRTRHSHRAHDEAAEGEWFDTIHPEDLPRTLASWSSALRTGQPFHDVHRAREPSGRYGRFLVDGVAMRDGDGRVVCWIGVKTAMSDPVDDASPSCGDALIGDLDGASDSAPQDFDRTCDWSAPPAQAICFEARSNVRHAVCDTSPAPGAAAPARRPLSPGRADRGTVLEGVTAAADAALCGSQQSLDPRLWQDSSIKALLADLSSVGEIPTELARLHSHSLCVAVLARIGGSRLVDRVGGQRRRVAPLPKWRLARVNQHIDAHMEGPIRLADLAKAAGLTSMHFAAQFRASLGMCPHEYLLRQRIKRAQSLLQDSRQRLVDVALSVGFQAQPHFSTVFRRFVGESPHRWRVSRSGQNDAIVRDASQILNSRLPSQQIRGHAAQN